MSPGQNIERIQKRIEKEFWVSTQGDIYKFDGDLSGEYISLHSEIARQLFPDPKHPKDTLFHLGWVMVGSVVYDCPVIDKPPTQAQINVLNDIGVYEWLIIFHNGSYMNYSEYLKLD